MIDLVESREGQKKQLSDIKNNIFFKKEIEEINQSSSDYANELNSHIKKLKYQKNKHSYIMKRESLRERNGKRWKSYTIRIPVRESCPKKKKKKTPFPKALLGKAYYKREISLCGFYSPELIQIHLKSLKIH